MQTDTNFESHTLSKRSAQFRFYEELNDFLPLKQRRQTFSYGFSGKPSVKDTLEALSVPHTEIELILVNGKSIEIEEFIAEEKRGRSGEGRKRTPRRDKPGDRREEEKEKGSETPENPVPATHSL